MNAKSSDVHLRDLELRIRELEEELAGTDWRQRATYSELEEVRSDRDRLWHEHQQVVDVLTQERDGLRAAHEVLENSLRLQIAMVIRTTRRAIRARFARRA